MNDEPVEVDSCGGGEDDGRAATVREQARRHPYLRSLVAIIFFYATKANVP
jgi:hypothetical protein